MIEQYKKTVDARGRTKFGLRDIRNKRRGISYTPRFSPIYPEYFQAPAWQPDDSDEGVVRRVHFEQQDLETALSECGAN